MLFQAGDKFIYEGIDGVYESTLLDVTKSHMIYINDKGKIIKKSVDDIFQILDWKSIDSNIQTFARTFNDTRRKFVVIVR